VCVYIIIITIERRWSENLCFYLTPAECSCCSCISKNNKNGGNMGLTMPAPTSYVVVVLYVYIIARYYCYAYALYTYIIIQSIQSVCAREKYYCGCNGCWFFPRFYITVPNCREHHTCTTLHPGGLKRFLNI